MDILNEEFLLFIKCAAQNNLRYMLIGGYAVNYYGYSRNTIDLDVWIAPTAENKTCFLNTLLCMKYTESEIAPLQNEDFTLPFVGNFGSPGNDIDVLTVVHHTISYEEAEKTKNIYEIEPDLFMNIVSYEFLLRMKSLTRRPKDYLDITELTKLRNHKK